MPALSSARPEWPDGEIARVAAMTDALAEPQAPRAHARIVYLGPVSPHWEVYGDWGDRQTLDEFRARVLARLVLLPREDPQFRRNRERIVRDAERELITIEWDLGIPTSSSTPQAEPATEATSDTETPDAPAEPAATAAESSDD